MNLFRVLSLFFVALVCSAAFADSVTYSYTGNDFTGGSVNYASTNGSSITGTLTLSGALGADAPLSDISTLLTGFSFSDGVNTISGASLSGSDNVALATDLSGAISFWAIDLFSGSLELSSYNALGTVQDQSCIGCLDTPTSYAFTDTGIPGTWKSTAVPEPATILLLAGGLPLVSLMVRRRMRQSRSAKY
jgi:hypothetical protein